MALGTPIKHDQKWAFKLEIDGFTSALFQKVSGYEAEIEVVEYSPGSAIVKDKAPGMVNFTNMVCERGAGVDEDAYKWFKETADAQAGVGSDTPYRNLDLVQLSRAQKELGRTNFFDCFPAKYIGGEWDGEASEVVIETLEIAYRLFERKRTKKESSTSTQ